MQRHAPAPASRHSTRRLPTSSRAWGRAGSDVASGERIRTHRWLIMLVCVCVCVCAEGGKGHDCGVEGGVKADADKSCLGCRHVLWTHGRAKQWLAGANMRTEDCWSCNAPGGAGGGNSTMAAQRGPTV
jgi:hypothetical protein